jgi:uncharacterized protein with beta-barrel porin domain
VLTFAACAFASLSVSSASAEEPLPESYDLRNIGGHSYIGPVRDQGALGACYAFSSLAAAESAYNLANGLYDENCADFSESFIVWTMDDYYKGLEGGDGSNLTFDELQALVDYGVCTEAEFPFSLTKPTDGDDHMDAPRVKFASWHRLPSYDVETMKRALLSFGALDVGILADNSFAEYAGGVLDSTIKDTNSILDYDGSMNHAVGLVGWNSDTGTWILRNSWGTKDWGEAGYANISYYSNRITTAATYLMYGDWTGEDFADANPGNVAASSVTVDGATHAYAYYRWGGNDASLTNNGSYSASVDAASGKAFTYGMFLWAGKNASMVNNGSVTSSTRATGEELATSYGMCLQGHSLTNTGTVNSTSRSTYRGRATAYGIRFFSFDHTGDLTNSGKVTATSYGTNAYAVGMQATDAATVTNSGSILAYGYASAGGLVVDECPLVVNTGDITGRTSTGSAYGVYARDSVFINRAGGVVTASTSGGKAFGVYALESYVYNEGTIVGETAYFEESTVLGTGVFQSKMECKDSVLSPGAGKHSIGTLSVTGSFYSESGLTMDLDVSGTKSDVLDVGGMFTIEGKSTLNVIPNGYVAGGDYTFIKSDGTSGDFTTVNTTAMFEGVVESGANGYTLDLTRHSYSDFSGSGVTVSMAEALDVIRPTADGGLATVLNSLDQVEAAASITGALNDLYPAMNATATFAALGGLRQTGGYIERHHKDGITSDSRKLSTWFSAMNTRSSRVAVDAFPSYSESMHGIIAGADSRLGNRWSVGVAASNATQSVDAADAGSASVRTRRGYVYAMWDESRDAEGAYFTTSLGVGSSRIDTHRNVEFLGETVQGRHGADNYSLALGAGYDFGDAIIKIRPFVGAEYDLLSEKAYAERDSSGAAIALEDNDSDSLSGQFGLAVSAHLNLDSFTFAPEVRVYRVHEFLDADSLHASFGGEAAFNAEGRNPTSDGNIAEATLRVIWANQITAGFSYTRAEYEDDSSSDSASVWVQVRL